jgi:hypothetical protein
VKVLVDVDGSLRVTVPVWGFVRSKVGELVDVVKAAGEWEGSGETVWVSLGKRKGILVSVSVDAGHGEVECLESVYFYLTTENLWACLMTNQVQK